MKLSKNNLKKLIESFLFEEEEAEEIEEEPVEDSEEAEEIEEEPAEEPEESEEEPAADAEESSPPEEESGEEKESESQIKIANIENESNAKKAAFLYANLLKNNADTGFEESIQIPDNVRNALNKLTSSKIPEKEKYNFKTFQNKLGSLFNALQNKGV